MKELHRRQKICYNIRDSNKQCEKREYEFTLCLHIRKLIFGLFHRENARERVHCRLTSQT